MFSKFNSVNVNKSPGQIRTHDLQFTSLILYIPNEARGINIHVNSREAHPAEF